MYLNPSGIQGVIVWIAGSIFMLLLHLSTKSTPNVDGFDWNLAKVFFNSYFVIKQRHNFTKPLVKDAVDAGKCLKDLSTLMGSSCMLPKKKKS